MSINDKDCEHLEAELNLPNNLFRENYLAKNKSWWENNSGYHERNFGTTPCARCGGDIGSPEDLRPLDGENYDSKCFKEEVLEQIRSLSSLEHGPTPLNVIEIEWMMKVARVMDGGLVKIAETDEDSLNEIEEDTAVDEDLIGSQ